MPAKPPGSEVRLTWDGAGPAQVGDELVTVTTGRRYLVLGLRRQTRGIHAGRWHLRCVVLAPDAPRDPDSTVHRIAWYPRRRRAR